MKLFDRREVANNNNENSLSKESKLRDKITRAEILREFSSNVTLHGFRYLVEEKGIRRAIWFFITSGCLIFSVILFYSILRDFLDFKTTTTSSTVYDKSNVDFPTITICPVNYVSMSKLMKLPNGLNPITLIEMFRKVKEEQHLDFSDPDVQSVMSKLNISNHTEVKQILKLYELDLKEMVSDDFVSHLSGGNYCTFDHSTCTVENFTQVFSWSASMCSQFNSFDTEKKPLTSNFKGIDGGFSIILNLYAEESVFSEYPFEGVMLHIGNYGMPHQMTEHTQNLILPTGMLSLIEISQKKVYLLPEPYSTKCGTKNLSIVKNRPYSKALCQLDCMLDIVYKECGCLGHDVEDLVDVKICNIGQLGCYLRSIGRLQAEKYAYCEKSCPQECVKTTYTINYSQARLGTNKVYHSIKELDAWKNRSKYELMQYISKNLCGIKVVFTDFSEVQETVTASVNWMTLIGTMGGSIGLCLGFSFVTIFEYVFLIFDLLMRHSNKYIDDITITNPNIKN